MPIFDGGELQLFLIYVCLYYFLVYFMLLSKFVLKDSLILAFFERLLTVFFYNKITLFSLLYLIPV